MSDPQLSLCLNEVTKQYGDFLAVDCLSLQVPSGVVYGLLGPNGAGKTTTLRMINDILRPDRGSISLLGGMSPGPLAAQHVGYLPEERGLYPKMKVCETLGFFGELRGLGRKRARRQADLWLERLQLGEWSENHVQDLSKGMQQKVQFAAALIHDPQLLILDEPWSGLDPMNADVLRDVVAAQKEAGKTILFSTHLMEQAESLCDWVCIMAKGKKAIEGKLEVLKREAASDGVVMLSFSSDADEERAREGVLQGPLVNSLEASRTGIWVQLAANVDPDALLARLVAEKLSIQHFEKQQASLHQIFVSRVGALSNSDRGGRIVYD